MAIAMTAVRFGDGFVRTIWRHLRSLLRAWFLLPTVVSSIYLFFIASDQYESEARFVVRSSARPDIPGGLGFLVQIGLGRSQDDSFIVQEFVTSRDAISNLKKLMPLQELFGRKDADFFARYPSFLYGSSEEGFYKYFQRMVTVIHVDKTGITTLRVRAFEPADAKRIAEDLLLLGEELVNRMNTRLQSDALRTSNSELREAQERLMKAQTTLTEYRNRELTIDPVKNAVTLGELIGKLSAELATTRAQITEVRSSSSGSPQLPALQRRAISLEDQITTERSRIARDDGGLAARIADYERLILEKEFANRMLTSAEAELVRSRAETTRQLLYLERVVEPNMPDYPQYPKRLRTALTIAAGNLLLALVVWLVFTGMREHAAHRS